MGISGKQRKISGKWTKRVKDSVEKRREDWKKVLEEELWKDQLIIYLLKKN